MAKKNRERAKTTAVSVLASPPADRRVAAPHQGWLRQSAVPVLLIVSCALAAHAASLQATFLWDDDINLINNPHLHDLAGLRRLWFHIGATNMYAPVTFTTLWIQHQLWGLNPFGYHLVNIAFHALNAVLVWVVLKRLVPSSALLAAALFAVHPVTVESVAWVTELRNVESAAIYLLCLLAYLRLVGLDAGPALAGRERIVGYGLVLVLFGLALLTKPSVVALPLVVVLVAWWKRGTVKASDLTVAAPMLLMSVVAGLLTMYVDMHFAGGRGADWQMSLLERTLVAARVVWFYAAKLVWPHPLVSIYPRWDVNAAVWWQYLFPFGLVAALAALWALRDRIGRGPLTAACCFVLLVAPTSGLFRFSYHLYSFVADRYQYHASIALLALLAAGAANLVRGVRQVPRLGTRLFAGSLVVGLGTVSVLHGRTYRNELTRCLAAVERNPRAWVAMNNIGVALNDEGRHEEAVMWYRRALSVRPVYPEAHSNLGVALVALGRSREALSHYEEALRVWPDYANAHNNMGTALAKLGDTQRAAMHYQAALNANPYYPEAHNNLAQLMTRAGDFEAAIRHHRAALRVRPTYAAAHHDLAVTLSAVKRYEEAVAEYREALRLQPADAETRSGLASALSALGRHGEAEGLSAGLPKTESQAARSRTQRGMALAAQGRLNEAAVEFEGAVRLDPNQAEAHNGLGNVLATTGQIPEAIEHYREAVRLNSDLVEARANLGKALASSGRVREAISELEEAIRRNDKLGEAHNVLGVCLAETGRLDDAILHFRRALDIDGMNLSARQNLDRALALKRNRVR